MNCMSWKNFPSDAARTNSEPLVETLVPSAIGYFAGRLRDGPLQLVCFRGISFYATCHSNCRRARISSALLSERSVLTNSLAPDRQSNHLHLANSGPLSSCARCGRLLGRRTKPHRRLDLGGGNRDVFGLAVSPCGYEYSLARRDHADRRLVVSGRLVARRDQAAMIAKHETISIRTRGKGTYEITERGGRSRARKWRQTGTVTIFLRHTSASLVIYENADPAPGRISMPTSKKSPRRMATTSTLSKGPTTRPAICAWP